MKQRVRRYTYAEMHMMYRYIAQRMFTRIHVDINRPFEIDAYVCDFLSNVYEYIIHNVNDARTQHVIASIESMQSCDDMIHRKPLIEMIQSCDDMIHRKTLIEMIHEPRTCAYFINIASSILYDAIHDSSNFDLDDCIEFHIECIYVEIRYLHTHENRRTTK